MTARKTEVALAAAAMALLLTACGGDAAPPEPGEAAVGTVAVDNAGAAENPVTPALPGGPAGQTPDYPNPAGTGSVIYSEPTSPPSNASGDPPL
jgi:hypothetical protein